MLKIKALVLVFLLLPSTILAAGAQHPLVKESVQELSALLTDGYAKLGLPLMVVPTGPDKVVAVLFSLEGPGGGDGAWEYIAFFKTTGRLLPKRARVHEYRLLAFKKIGAVGVRWFKMGTVSVQHGRVNVRGAAWAPQDAVASPSIPLHSLFWLHKGQIVEQHVSS
ncbi:MAG TPA: hypothetical protein VFP92_09015 [Rhodanobacteraceae bacterium]|nr:hypothetical protein [Rhodanobacteraceae bacterium]